MSTAKDLLDQRLARGEISSQEYDDILGKIGRSPHGSPPPLPSDIELPPPIPSTSSRPSPSKSGENWFLKSGLAVLVFVLIFAFIKYNRDDNTVTIGNVNAEDRRVTFKISNLTQSDRDTLVWIEQNEIEKCNKILNVKSNMVHDVSFYCQNLGVGKFRIMNAPASSDAKRASISERIK